MRVAAKVMGAATLPSREGNVQDLLERSKELVSLWRPRLGIAERINVEVVPDDESTERELEARCIPVERDGEGLWEFTIQVGDTIEAERLERAIVHELVHVLVEPLGRWLFKEPGYDWPTVINSMTEPIRLSEFETVVDRIADAYLRAFSEVTVWPLAKVLS